jgi:tRNA-intron endonuclease, archaea type
MLMVFQIYLPGLFSNSQQAINLAKTKKFGEFKQNKVTYTSYEAFYLIESKKANAYLKEKRISQEKVLKLFSKKDKEFLINYIVYKNLRGKAYIPKTGLKFGAEFRVYEKNKNHATYLTLITTQKDKINLKEFISKNRVAHSTAKKLLLAIVDPQQDVTYYEISWKKL